jgi:hypothetical protein
MQALLTYFLLAEAVVEWDRMEITRKVSLVVQVVVVELYFYLIFF